MLFIGFGQAQARLDIKNHAAEVKIFGQMVPVRAQVESLEKQFSESLADTPERPAGWLAAGAAAPKQTYLVAAACRSRGVAGDDGKDLAWKVQVAVYKQKVPIA